MVLEAFRRLRTLITISYLAKQAFPQLNNRSLENMQPQQFKASRKSDKLIDALPLNKGPWDL